MHGNAKCIKACHDKPHAKMPASARLQTLVEKELSHLALRGMRTNILDDDTLLLEDIDEWLSEHQERLNAKSSDKLVFSFFLQNTRSCERVVSFTVCISIIKMPWYWKLWIQFLAFFSMFIFFVWVFLTHVHAKRRVENGL
jgi:hypothetical protein